MNPDTASNSGLEQKRKQWVEALISGAAKNPRALALLAHEVQANGDEARARSLALRARDLAPEDPEVALLAAEVLNLGIPDWHFSMVRDAARNAAFDQALRRAVRPGMRVLDIGSGTGLLAMMAIRAGAAEVISCESQPAIAEAARAVVAANGYAKRIRILAKHSDDLDPALDLGGQVDLLVAEVIGNGLLNEGILPSIQSAAQKLLKPGGKIIPSFGSVRVALARYPRADKRSMDTVDGFDLSAFNELGPKTFRLKWYERTLELVSEPADLFTFDFASGGPFLDNRSRTEVRTLAGTANGIVQWIRFKTDDAHEYENHPLRTERSHWSAIFYPLSREIHCRRDGRVILRGSHDRRRLRVWLEDKENQYH